MSHSFHDKILRVDLTHGKISVEEPGVAADIDGPESRRGAGILILLRLSCIVVARLNWRHIRSDIPLTQEWR
jgi:hypothetical protein